MNLDAITLAQAADLVAARKLSPVELVQAKIARVEALDAQVNAFITPTFEEALRRARVAEAAIAAGQYRGPLHGIPFGLKDIYATAGIRTTGHSKVCIDNVPSADAAVTERLYDAGGILLGKLATHEFAHGSPNFEAPWPPARNPWNREHATGGSSSGSGAAVAAGFVLAAMGTDTGGSIRNPAACCGTAGLKPTYGLVSRRGVIPNSYTFDHCGPLAWTVEDCAIVLDAIAGYDARDPASVYGPAGAYRASLGGDVRGLKIGVIRHFWEEDLKVSAEVARAMDAAIEVFRKLGATVEDARMRPLQQYLDVKMVIAETEIFSVHHKELLKRPGDFGMPFLAQTLAGCLFDGVDYVRAQRERARMLAEMAPLYDRYDVLLTVSSAPAPRFDRMSTFRSWIQPNIHTAFSVTAGPALVLCNGCAESGLPLAMQIVGRPFDDAAVLRAGHAYEQATDWRSRRPKLEAGVPRPDVTPPPILSGAAVDAEARAFAERRARRAGLTLNQEQMALLYEVAPYALAMAQRIPSDYAHDEEPAGTFHLPEARVVVEPRKQ
jgi:aspartyl-tRNA(Asn)/glutamyl-tRNA(Gln) amidotransferase subunit A